MDNSIDLKNPIFSIVIPTYNRAERLAKAIQSVLDQTIDQFELIVVNDGSTDKTEEVVKSFEGQRIKYIEKRNEERAIARNTGIEESNGEYVTFLDSDDELYAPCLEEALNVIEINNNPEWLHMAYEIKNEEGKIIRQENKRKGDINKTLITGNHLSCIGVFVRQDIIKRNRFNTNPDLIGSEDYVLWMQLASQFPLKYSNRICACLHQHSERSVENFNVEKLVRRVSKSIELISKLDPPIMKRSKFVAHRYAYLSLHSVLGGYKKVAVKYLFRSIQSFPTILLNKKTLYIALRLILVRNE